MKHNFVWGLAIFGIVATLTVTDKGRYGEPSGLDNAADSTGYGVTISGTNKNLNVGGNLSVGGTSDFTGLMSASSLNSGTGTFTTTATNDTVLISGVTASSIFVVAIKDVDPVAADLLSWTVNTDTLFLHRAAGTTSGLAYSYIRLD